MLKSRKFVDFIFLLFFFVLVKIYHEPNKFHKSYLFAFLIELRVKYIRDEGKL